MCVCMYVCMYMQTVCMHVCTYSVCVYRTQSCTFKVGLCVQAEEKEKMADHTCEPFSKAFVIS